MRTILNFNLVILHRIKFHWCSYYVKCVITFFFFRTLNSKVSLPHSLKNYQTILMKRFFFNFKFLLLYLNRSTQNLGKWLYKKKQVRNSQKIYLIHVLCKPRCSTNPFCIMYCKSEVMYVFQMKLIIGFHSSIYSIRF